MKPEADLTNTNVKFISKREMNAKILDTIKTKTRLREEKYTENEWIWRQHWHNEHLEKVRKAYPKVDSKGPMLPITVFTSVTKFSRQMAKENQREKDNSILLKKIQAIYKGKSSIDNRLSPFTKFKQSQNKRRKEQFLKETYDNVNKFQRLVKVKPFMSREADSEWYQQQLKYMENKSKYPLYWKSKLYSQLETSCERKSLSKPRPIVFLDIELKDVIVDRIFIQLYADICPITSENFRLLCVNDKYNCCLFNKIWLGMYWRCSGGASSCSAFGEPLECENFKIKHNVPGLISMMSYGPKTIEAAFMISARPLPMLDGKYVAFGKIIWGLGYLNFLSKACKPSEVRQPERDVIITASGEIDVTTMNKMLRPKLAKDANEEAQLAKLLVRLKRGIHKTKKIKLINTRYRSLKSASASAAPSATETVAATDEDDHLMGSSGVEAEVDEQPNLNLPNVEVEQ